MNQSGCIIVNVANNSKHMLKDKINIPNSIWILVSVSGEIFYCGGK